jgi:uncharacterized membrane protein YkoI
MMHSRPLALACLSLAALLSGAAQAQERAASDDQFHQGQFHLSQFQRSQWDLPRSERTPDAREKSLSEILRMLKSRFSGRHLDARRMGDYYIVSWITEDGQRLTLRVNAITGNVE